MAKPNETDRWAVGSEPEAIEKLLHGEAGIWNLGSGCKAQVCGASELTYCGTSVVCLMCTLLSSFAWALEGGAKGPWTHWILKLEKRLSFGLELVK